MSFRACAPALLRRLSCFLYEGVLLFGVVMVAGFLFATITKQRHALVGTAGLQAWLFLVLGAYFVVFWTRRGQTLAMQTWQIRLLTLDGHVVSWRRAVCRYLLAWMWFMPALVGLRLAGLSSPAPVFSALGAGVLAYAGLARLHPQRQFWHDAVCRTCLIDSRPGAPPAP